MSMEQLLSVKVPATLDSDDCVYCFETMKNKDQNQVHSLHICLSCFQCFCGSHWEFHQEVVVMESGATHDLYLKVSKTLKPKEETNTPPLEKKLKLEVKDVNEDDLYDTHWTIGSLEHGELVSSNISQIPKELLSKVNKILNTKSTNFQDMSSSWVLEVKPCKHVSNFDISNCPKVDFKLSDSCAECGLTSNLWACLHCGHIGCGREQVGIEGHSHALKHYKDTDDHCLALKLGSLSRDTSDVYCYSCDEDVRFTDVSKWQEVLNNWNIELQTTAKEKTLIELQIEQSMNWDFHMVDSQGNSLRQLKNGPQYGVGLLNLGNSCYLNSILQVLLNGGVQNWNIDNLGDFPVDIIYPRNNLKCQLIKLRNAMTKEASKYSSGIKPTNFKKTIAGSHQEFSSGRQQDALEFFTYLSDKLDKDVFSKAAVNPNDLFRFNIQDKLKCTKCNQVKLINQTSEVIQLPLQKKQTVQKLEDRLADYFNGESIEFHCPTCKTKTVASKRPGFSSFPEALIISPIRIELVNWQPQKTSEQLSVPGIRDFSILDVTGFKAQGQLSGESAFFEEQDSFKFNEAAIKQLIDMGFSENGAKRALYATGNNDSESAMNWLFQHMDDPDLNSDFNPEAKSQDKRKVDPESLENMIAMGLDAKLCRKALILNNGNVNSSVEWVFSHMEDDGELPKEEEKQVEKQYGSTITGQAKYRLTAIVCHKGNSVHSGHYVAFLKKVVDGTKQWVLYNDEKIVLANDDANMEEMEKNGYIYIFNLEHQIT